MTTTSSNKENTSTAVIITLASLATDTNLLVGRVATAVDNTSNLYNDYSLTLKFTTGTSPTASKQGEWWLSASEDGTIYSGGSGASDAGKTFVAETKALLFLLGIVATNATSNTAYELVIPSLVALIGAIPRKFNIFFVHNTGVNLNSTGGNHVVSVTGKQFTSV